ncbi:hypothetical protein BBW65_07635 [Helicobacter enhydrae]|uniref:Uncharacterized protein n=1 Tax=Helicobacter enhydrae TaxID=222136 RepID=A0A1B1U7B4_9HELI|nr:hypothetical protein [Helicobacter enhydrae]ANV98674.1 hypothetical protein BBW65_07635 [Helicobacter enhydrae]
MEFLRECRECGIETRIVESALKVDVRQVEKIGGETYEEYIQLNRVQESGIERWLKHAKGRDYDGDELMLDLLVEMFKKIEKLEKMLAQTQDNLLTLHQQITTSHIGHGVLCFQESVLKKGGIYYGRLFLPFFPEKIMPCYLQAHSAQIAKIIKMGDSNTRQYDTYVVECERIGIRARREG